MCVKFGSFQKKLLIPIIFPIFLLIRNTILEKEISSTCISTGFNDFLSLTIFGVLHLIRKYKSKSSNAIDTNQEQRNINENNNEENNHPLIGFHAKMKKDYDITLKTRKTSKIKQFLFVSLISFLQLSAVFSDYIWRNFNNNNEFRFNSQTLFQLIFLTTFSICFLDFSIYSHQIFSIIIIFICLIIFFIELIIYHNLSLNYIISANIIIVFQQFFYCLSDVLGKIYLIIYIGNLYLFLFKLGIIGLIPLIIFNIICYFANISQEYQLFQFFVKNKIWVLLLHIFLNCLFELSLWLTIYYFTPCHYIIYESITNFLEIISYKILGSKNNLCIEEKITYYILYPFLLFGTFVFNEIIILNFCGLSHTTTYEIM